jgi:hypothetical protein
VADAIAELVAPVLFPLTWVEVYKPVTREVSTNNEVEFEVLTVSGEVTFTHSVTHGSIETVELLEQPATDTVVIAAVALELCANAELHTTASKHVHSENLRI